MTQYWQRLVACGVLVALVLGTPPPIPAQDQSWKVTQDTLANGLTVVILEDHRAPVVSLQVWYKVGSRNEQLGITGISHLLEHLMFRGTTKYGPGEFSRLVQGRGGSHNAFTAEDNTVYFENAAAPHLDLLLDLEADRMANLILDDTAFTAEKKIVMEERRMRTVDEPAAELMEQVNAAAYTAHPYGWPVVGWMHDLMVSTAKVNPIPGLHELLVSVVVPNWLPFALAQAAGETVVAILLILGVATRWAGILGLLLAVNLALTVAFGAEDGFKWLYYLAVLANAQVIVSGPGPFAVARFGWVPAFLR